MAERPPLPEDVVRVAAGLRLGNVLSTTRPGQLGHALLGVLVATATSVVPLACIGGIFGDDHTWLCWAFGVVAALVLLAETVTVAWQRWLMKVYAVEFEHGLVYVDSGHGQAFRWEDVQLVLHADYVHGAQGTGGYVYRTVLRSPTGKETVVNPRLAFDRIEQHLTDAAVDRARAALARGEKVTFGPVTVGSDGLAAEAGRVDWFDLERVEQTRQEIRIYRRGERRPVIRIRIGKVPDAAAVVRLATDRRPTPAR